MTPLPDWILDGFERSGLPAFEKFARDARAGQHTPATAPKAGPLKTALPDHEAPHTSESEKDPVETLMALYEDLYTESSISDATLLSLDSEVTTMSSHVPQSMGLDQTGDLIRLDLALLFPDLDADEVERHQRQLVAFAFILAQDDPFTLGSTPADVHVHLKSGVLHLIYEYPGQVPPHPQRAALLRRAAAVTQLRGVARELRELLPMASAPARAESTDPMNATGSAPSGVTASRLTPGQLQALDEQYRVKHSSGDVQVTELVSQNGLDVQASRPAWPQHLMISGDGDGTAGTAYIEFQYLLPELPGEDLGLCARECRAAILSVLPEDWRDAAEIEVDRRVSHKQLNIICGHHVDVLPGEEGCVALLREVAVRCADLNLMGTLAAALYAQVEVQAQLAAEEDEEEPEGVSAWASTAELDTVFVRTVYEQHAHDEADSHWDALLTLKHNHAHVMELMPTGLMLQAIGDAATVLMLTFQFDALGDPEVQERIRRVRPGDPLNAVVTTISQRHLAPLGLAGSLQIDVSLEDDLLKLHFVSPGVLSRDEAAEKLFAVAAAFWHHRLLADLEAALQNKTAQDDEEEAEEASSDEQDDRSAVQALESLLLRVFYEREQESAADGSWKAYVALKPEHAHVMDRLPVGVMLQPGQEFMILMVTLRLDEFDDPAAAQRLRHLRPGDPVQALIAAFSRDHLAPLGLAGTLHIDISLDDELLKVHFVSPGEVAQEEAPRKLFEVLDACQERNLVTDIQALLQAEDVGDADEGTLDSATLLSAGFLKRAGLRLLEMRGDSFTEVAWDEPDGRGGMGLLWLEPTSTTPYPVLAMRTATLVPQSDAPDIVAAAMQDHFMKFNVPPSVVDHLSDNWMAARTLAPALYVHPQGNGQTQVTSIRSWPIAGPVTPALLQYMAVASFGQFQNLLQRAGFNVTPDYTPPRPTGRGDRDWLTQQHLLGLVGNDRVWQPKGTNEIICMVRGSIENESEQPRGLLMFRKAKATREIRHTLYLRYVSTEEDSVPGLYLRAHTEGSLGRNKESLLAQHHLKHLKPLLGGGLLPVTVDKDGDLTIRQIVLCPARPTPELVRHLVQVAERSLYFAAQQVVF